MRVHQRIEAFSRRAQQEAVLHEVNGLLGSAERLAYGGAAKGPTKPLLLIVGAPRSGTTLALQWLAASGAFAYPTNLLARFFGAPFMGCKIQQLLTDPRFDFRNELSVPSDIVWASDVGKTSGLLQPHEFFYFWRRFFPVDQAQRLSPEQLAASDPSGFARGWALIEQALEKPIAAKGILLQYDIARLAEWLPTAIFVHTTRDPLSNMQSLLEARERVFATREGWFSVKPPEYEWLSRQDPYTQVAGQVLFTNRSIQEELAQLPADRSMSLSYEAFCSDPRRSWAELRRTLSVAGHVLASEYAGPRAFECSNRVRGSEADVRGLRDAYGQLNEAR